jgi:hypothetical protein
MRWLKKVLTGGKKEGDRDRGKEPRQNAADTHVDGAITMPPIERRRWSFAKARSSVADASRRPSVTAVVAGELSQVRPCSCGQERETEAAVLIQKAFRGYLVRPSLLFIIVSYSVFFLKKHRIEFPDEHAASV